MAGDCTSNDLHILKIPLAFFGLHRGTADAQAVQRLENYIVKLKEELRRHAIKANEMPNYFLPEDFKQALSAMPIVLFRVGDEFEMPVDCAAILFEHAYLAFYAYRQRPQEEKSLLDILQSNPEYTGRMGGRPCPSSCLAETSSPSKTWSRCSCCTARTGPSFG